MDRRIILPLVVLLLVVALVSAGAVLGQTTAPPSNPLPSPLTAGWQAPAGSIPYVTDSGSILGSAPDKTLGMDLFDIRASIVESSLYQGAYESDGTYSAMQIVSVGSGVATRYFIYSSPTERSTAHDPRTSPGHWREIGRLTSMQPSPGSTPAHFAGGELIVIGTDIYLCLTAPPAAVDANAIASRPEFVRLATVANVDGLVSIHNAAADAHPDLRVLVTSLISNLARTMTAGAYSDTATYRLGTTNSLVTHGGKAYLYTSGVARSQNHEPDLFPQFWTNLTDATTLVNLGETDSIRVSRGTLILMASDDALFLTTTDAGSSNSRTAATIRANAGPGGDFVRLNGPPPGLQRMAHSAYTGLTEVDPAALYITTDASDVVRLYLGSTLISVP